MKKENFGIGRAVLRMAAVIIGVMLTVILCYVAYVYFSYDRIEDYVTLEIVGPDKPKTAETVKIGEEYGIVTYNIGFGAYTPEFSFFMDGGESSVAVSKESVIEMVEGAGKLAESCEPDFMIWEEVDIDSTRSYWVNQWNMLSERFPEYYSQFAVNYDSAFLYYPFTEPHGKSKAGIAVYSKYPIESAVRRSFPISTSLSKFFDLDRCYSVSKVSVDNGKYLCIYAVHMSAYGNSDTIREGQITMLCQDMEAEYRAGNYVICGGDFNHDLKALTDDGSQRASWAYPFPRENLPEGISFCIDAFTEEEKEKMHNTSRNADMAYEEGVTFTITLDGFMISDNVICTDYEHIDAGYAYSDHDPVCMRFCLME